MVYRIASSNHISGFSSTSESQVLHVSDTLRKDRSSPVFGSNLIQQVDKENFLVI